MDSSCHLCGAAVAVGESPDDVTGFECADCGEPTCMDCKSLGVARASDHCKQCRG